MKKLNKIGDFAELKYHNHYYKFELIINDMIKIEETLGYDFLSSVINTREEARGFWKSLIKRNYTLHRLISSEED